MYMMGFSIVEEFLKIIFYENSIDIKLNIQIALHSGRPL